MYSTGRTLSVTNKKLSVFRSLFATAASGSSLSAEQGRRPDSLVYNERMLSQH